VRSDNGWGSFAGCGQIGEHVAYDIGKTAECFNPGGSQPGQ
jgi:hypothetical protein